ncbi:G-type lectin S-receptor-like serine/threonine-protein kinase At4g03230 [Pistacia vera]|uniref:G-type lectin S-receptor-like serine/threonine-protein kinase At4g03230 n=1 Tax=Pistacia vera TaxID=55513 RepID=UPI001262C5DC|nr:G-type lectin S-receptor-like serine/threonine-protein kinase At4g03230 [Pistacia vera]
MERPERRVTVRWPPNPNNLPSTICFLYTILSCSFVLCCSTRDTITVDSLLKDGETLVSAGNRFELGFFNPTKRSEGNRRYVGIWYYNSNPRVVVWVANRDNPLPVSTGVFGIADDGNLKIFDPNGTVHWDTKCEKSPPLSRVAKLMDSGNLVLTDDRLAMSSWESFKQPTDTFLPGMKMDENLTLTSWISQDDPAVGNFTFGAVLADNQYHILRKYLPYWKSGEPGKSFTEDEMPPFITKLLSNLSQNLNVKPSNSKSPFDNINMSTIDLNNSRLTMSFTGQIQLWSKDKVKGWSLIWWKPRDRCGLINHCGNFGICNSSNKLECTCLPGFMPVSPENWDSGDYTGGCQRKTKFCPGKDLFLSLKKVKVESEYSKVPATNETDCLEQCRNTCQCQAYSYDEPKNSTRRGDPTSTTTCLLWTEDLSGIQEEYGNDGPDLHVRVAASDTENGNTTQDGGGYPKRGRKKWTLIVGATVAGVILLSSTTVYFYLRRKNVERQENRESIRQNMAARFYDSARHVKDLVETDQFKEDKKGIDLPFFDFESILAATDNFSESNILGKGGFGPVYKGKFPGGQEIAVKRLSSVSGQGLEEFKNEVVLIARLQHRNLVKLLGYCIEGGEKILLYEYMPNKSLDSFIFGPTLIVLLDWEMRFNIILGIARGILYLHQDSRLRIIHRDLKTSNVLLDQEMNPKISDFGLAKIFEGKQTEGSTNRVVGTYGYMSPEYALDGYFSTKSDVFSFGVVVLEIVSGKKNTGFYNSEEALSLLGYAWRLWQEDKALDIMDQKLSPSFNKIEILKCINVGLLCVREDPNDRPTMSNVVIMLGSETATLTTPKRPAFVLRRGPSTSASSSSKLDINSELTVSLTGR